MMLHPSTQALSLGIERTPQLRIPLRTIRFGIGAVHFSRKWIWVETQRWSRVGADLRRAVVSIDEIDGQKHGSASYAVNNHTKRNSTGRKFINTNDTLLRLRTDTGYVRWHMDQC